MRSLAPRAIEVAGRLVHVRGREQMTLRLFGTRTALDLAPPAPQAPARGRLRPGTRYLTERRRLHAGAAVPELDPIRRALDGLVADERVQRHATPPLLASAYHLVPRGRGARVLDPSRTGSWHARAVAAHGERSVASLRVRGGRMAVRRRRRMTIKTVKAKELRALRSELRRRPAASRASALERGTPTTCSGRWRSWC